MSLIIEAYAKNRAVKNLLSLRALGGTILFIFTLIQFLGSGELNVYIVSNLIILTIDFLLEILFKFYFVEGFDKINKPSDFWKINRLYDNKVNYKNIEYINIIKYGRARQENLSLTTLSPI